MHESQQQSEAVRVLVVEDDEVYRELLVLALSSQGYQVSVADSGARAVEIFGHARPDLILLDMLMPAMDGLSFLRWLREERGAETPVLVLTCLDDRSLIVDALVTGANDVLIKPVGVDLLIRKADGLLQQLSTAGTGGEAQARGGPGIGQ